MIPLRKVFTIVTTRDSGSLSDQDSRVRKAALSSLAQAANKAARILVTILSVPLMIGYLGKEQFGLAMAIVGFAQWFLFDTGIAEGMKVRLLETFAQNDRHGSRAFVSTGTLALLIVTAVAAMGFYVSFPFVDWGHVFNVNADDVNLHAAILFIVSIMLVMMPLAVLREIYTADQRGYLFSLWMLTGTAGSLLGIWLATQTNGGLAAVLAGMYLPVVLASVGCCIHLFCRHMPWIMPLPSGVSMTAWRKMWPDCASLFLLGGSLMVINGTDIFIVNHYRGGGEASVYALSIRIFFYVQVIVSFLTYPAWPALSDAIQRGENRWTKKAAKVLFIISFGVSIPLCGLLVVFGGSLIRVWSRGEVETNQTLLLLLGVYLLIRIWCALCGIMLRALGRVRLQGLATFAEAVLHVLLGIYLVQRMGLVGFAVGSVASILLTRAWALPCDLYLAFTKKSGAGSLA